MSQKNDWELLDPQLKNQINNLNRNIINLTDENKKLRKNFDELKDENNKLYKSLNEFNNQLDNIKKMNIEHSSMFNQIKEYLEIGREKYLTEFKAIENKIEDFETNYDEKLHKIEQNITKHTNEIFDPTYRMRMNNIRWRNNQQSTGKDYINNPL